MTHGQTELLKAFLKLLPTLPIYLFCLRGSTAHLLVFNEPERVTTIIIPVAYYF